VAGLVEIFKMIMEDTAGRRELWHNIEYLRHGLNTLGFDTGLTASAIIPVIVGDEEWGRGEAQLKDLRSGDSRSVARADLPGALLEALGRA